MTKLSLCMIVRDEEESLPRCLDSVRNLVAEMVVVDTGSADSTVKVARDLGAKVYHYQWHDDFAAARNQGLTHVTGDWVLVLDADERLNPEIVPALEEAIADEANLVVNLVRQEIGSASSPYSLVSRLFRHHPHIKFSRPYHGTIDDSVADLLAAEPHWQVVDLPATAIVHYGYQPEAIASRNKLKLAEEVMEKYRQENPQDAYVCNKLGALYLQKGEAKKGIKLLRAALKSNLANPPILFELHYHLANALVRQQKTASAIKHYQKAIEQPILEKLKIGAYNNLASLYQTLGDWQNALKVYQCSLQIEPNFSLTHYNLGLTYRAMGRTFKAINAYQQTIKLNPDYPWAYQNLAVLLLKQGQIEDSVRAFQKAIALHQQQNPPEASKLKQELAAMGIVL